MKSLPRRRNPLYRLWIEIRRRCHDPKRKSYKYYGDRGIFVCDEWMNNFPLFQTWCILNNWKKGLTIDRINNDLGYYPTNCRFVTRSENSQNKRHLISTNKSGYRGVSKANKYSWRAMITCRRKLYDIGTFKSKEEAAIAYNNWVIKHKTKHSLNKIHT